MCMVEIWKRFEICVYDSLDFQVCFSTWVSVYLKSTWLVYTIIKAMHVGKHKCILQCQIERRLESCCFEKDHESS
ncbi:hypothetical protein ES332_D01G086100v1 [Gossypium tomentosum]|uniref:Uncharacterized protein n=1 Tax=Gossypium tomentosum TaxID=34277 RepID=A0A5D2M6V6_GOSTO|nr:hypothetical protein ES332_D01G086100v1 [Gossypium tomentosum]